MSVTLAVLTTDGRRDCIQRTIASAIANVEGDIEQWVIFTDNDDAYFEWLQRTFCGWMIVALGPKAGYAAAMRAAFAWLAKTATGLVFWLEDDFTFNRTVNVDDMSAVLTRNSQIAQLALRRQSWNDTEREAGGIVESHPDWYTDCYDAQLRAWWLEQTAFWTNNPSLIPPWVFDVDYPASEGEFTFAVKAQRPDACFGYWGDRHSGEAIKHIGDVRVGAVYS